MGPEGLSSSLRSGPPVVTRSESVRDWGTGLLVIGAVVLVFAVLLAMQQVLVAQVSDANYPFFESVPAAIGIAALLVTLGAVLRIASRRPPKEPS